MTRFPFLLVCLVGLVATGCGDDLFGSGGNGGAGGSGGTAGTPTTVATIQFAHFDPDAGMLQVNDQGDSTSVTFLSGFGQASGQFVRGAGTRSFDLVDPADASNVLLTTPAQNFAAGQSYIVLVLDGPGGSGSQILTINVTEDLASVAAGDGGFAVVHAEESSFGTIDVDLVEGAESIVAGANFGDFSEVSSLFPGCYVARIDTAPATSDPEDNVDVILNVAAGMYTVAVITAEPGLLNVFELFAGASGALSTLSGGSCP